MKNKNIIISVIFILIIGIAIASFSFFSNLQNLNTSKHKINKPVTLRIGYAPIADCAQLYIAIEKGFFAKEGISVKLVSLAGGAKILEALGAQSVDVGFSNNVSLILAHASGLPFIGITGGPLEDEKHREHAILIRTDSPVKNISDLRGKKIALNTGKNIDALMVTLLLEKNGIKPKEVSFVEIPFPRMLGVLDSGGVDAIAAIEPYVTLGLQSSKYKVISYNYVAVAPRTEVSTYVVNRNWADKNSETINAFKKAISNATIYANNNPDYVRKVVAKYTHLTDKQLKKTVIPAFTDKLSPALLELMIAKVAETGWIKNKFDAKAIIY